MAPSQSEEIYLSLPFDVRAKSSGYRRYHPEEPFYDSQQKGVIVAGEAYPRGEERGFGVWPVVLTTTDQGTIVLSTTISTSAEERAWQLAEVATAHNIQAIVGWELGFLS